MTALATVTRHPATSAAELVAAFLDGRAPGTVRAYRADLDDFAGFLGASTIADAARRLLALPHGAANAVGLRYRTELVARELAPATINRRLSALRSLVALARTVGLVPWTLEVRNVERRAYRDTRGPGRDAVAAMLADARDTDARDYAVLRLLWDLGLRCASVASLRAADVDLDRATVSVATKGHTERTLRTLPALTRDALADHLAQTRAGRPFPSVRTIRRIVARYGERAGVTARPHGIRHSAITTALDLTDGDLRRVQAFSGHADVRTLRVYDDNRRDFAGEIASLIAEV